MRFRNAVHITIDNFSSAFKMLLYRLIVGVLIFSLVYVILQLSLSVIMTSVELQTLKGLGGEFFRALFGGDSERLSTFQSDFNAALSDFLERVNGEEAALATIDSYHRQIDEEAVKAAQVAEGAKSDGQPGAEESGAAEDAERSDQDAAEASPTEGQAGDAQTNGGE